MAPLFVNCYEPQRCVCSCLGQPLGMSGDTKERNRTESAEEPSLGSMAPLQNGFMLFLLHRNDAVKAGLFHLHYVSHVYAKLILA